MGEVSLRVELIWREWCRPALSRTPTGPTAPSRRHWRGPGCRAAQSPPSGTTPASPAGGCLKQLSGHGQVRNVRGISDLAPSREAPVSSRRLRWEVYRGESLCAAFAAMKMLTENILMWWVVSSSYLVKQQLCSATKFQCHIHPFSWASITNRIRDKKGVNNNLQRI